VARFARGLGNNERRNRLRFPLDAELRFEAFLPGNGKPIQGAGRAENMSSTGLAFRSDIPLPRGSRLSVSLAWPARLDNQCLLRMVFEGDVVRCEDGLVVLTIERYEFRTSGKANSPARHEVAAMAHSIEMHFPSKVLEPNTWAKRPAS